MDQVTDEVAEIAFSGNSLAEQCAFSLAEETPLMPGCWVEFTSLLSSSINERIKKNPQVSRSESQGLLGSVALTAISLRWFSWGVGWRSCAGEGLSHDKHDHKVFPYKAGQMTVAA